MGRRRALAAGSMTVGALGSAPSRGQSGRPPRVGYLSFVSPPDRDIEAFRVGMRGFGHEEGRTYVLEIRYAERRSDRFEALLDELLAAGISILVVRGPSHRVAPLASRKVPVVFAMSGDPVDAGIIGSLARPGGNVTGISFLAFDLVPKRLSLLKEAAPSIRRVGVISNPSHAGERNERRLTVEAAQTLGLEIVYQRIDNAADVDAALAAVEREGCDALTAFPEALTSDVARELADFAVTRRMASIFGWRNFCVAGGMMSYGPSLADTNLRIGYFVDRIVKGASPADLPAELPRTIEFVINQRTAKRLGLEIPHVLVMRADELIE
ncbi:MAG: ABC transporter substrate-binding protein [Alphaproteobacteria bacterium]|nr:ABC transporter substrate-binding protein [Alphaproteobacteria bacterium]